MKTQLVYTLLVLSAAALPHCNAQDGPDLQNLGNVLNQLDLSNLDRQLAEARRNLAGMDPGTMLQMARLQGNLGSLAFDFDQASTSHDSEYQHGQSALDAGRFDEAAKDFNAVVSRKGSRTDAALYWLAYAQDHAGRPGEALATLATLKRDYPQSRWKNDAQALEAEIHGHQGRAPDPAAENNEEMKMIALQSLMDSDPAQAVPILRKVLNGSQPPAIKDKALFVLAQSGAPEGRELLLDIARGKTNPDLQLKAVRYISMMGGDEAKAELGKIYAASNEVDLKREIIRSYLLSGSSDKLLVVAKSEKNPDLQKEAIHTLAQTGGKDQLWALYKSVGPTEVKREIVQSMLMDGDSDHLLEIAKTEHDPELRKAAIRTLGMTGGGRDPNALMDLYRNESDASIKREIIQGLFIQQNAKGLIQLARQEKDPDLKKRIVSQLALIHSKESTEYMLEILK